MNYADLHNDTIFECYDKNISLSNENLAVNTAHLKKFDKSVIVFAIWISDNNKDPNLFEKLHACYTSKIKKINKKTKTILAVENASGLDAKTLYHADVQIASLTWNGANEYAHGASCANGGLTKKGKIFIMEAEKLGLLIDASHLNEKSFYGVVKHAKNPVIATHSNSKAVFDHPRNLSDDQFRVIKNNGGIVGINLYPQFLNGCDTADYEDLLHHIEHFLNLGGQNTLCMGSDFDGAQMDPKWKNAGLIPEMYEYFNKKLGKNICNKIFFENADNFFIKNLK